MFDTLWIDCNIATMTPRGAPYGAVQQGALGVKDGRIAFVGPRADLRHEDAREVRRCDGGWITPGLIDCHTHLVFGGDRAREFELRLQGKSYEEIARAGGGIVSTIAATRAASPEALIASAARRLSGMTREGLTTVEIKSGYGGDLETELKQLETAAALGEGAKVRVQPTFLGLHALPNEFKEDRAAYVELVAEVMIPAIAAQGAATAFDAFCEGIGFTAEEVDYVFKAARKAGLKLKLHAEQLSNQQGAAMAARHQALSADHLEYLDDAGVAAMAKAGMVAVLLPGAFYFLRETKSPPIAKLRAAGVKLAVAGDCNPGTSPMTSPLMALNMACTLFQLTPEEALAGMTREAAHALGLQDEIGTLEVGKAGDLAIWNVSHPAELSYWLGAPLLRERVFAGRLV
jgi:imidazolonepropionase